MIVDRACCFPFFPVEQCLGTGWVKCKISSSCWICIQARKSLALCIWWKCAMVMVSLGVRTRAKDLTPPLLSRSVASVMTAPSFARPFPDIRHHHGLSTLHPLPHLTVWGWIREPHFWPNESAYFKLRESRSPGYRQSKWQKWDVSTASLFTMLSTAVLCFQGSRWYFLPSWAFREKIHVWICSCPPLSQVSQGYPRWPFSAPWFRSDLSTWAALHDSFRRWKFPPLPVVSWTLRILTSKQQSPRS